jgi:putative hydrolase of the HAD superfamily
MPTLFIDADDTLWENNIYFEAVVHHYCVLVGAHGVPADEARGRLLAIERVRTTTHGYGIKNFNQSLREACRSFLDGAAAPLVEELDRHCAGIATQPMALLPGVADTLAALATRHRLVLLTKGDPDDQHDKIGRSGLAGHFGAVDVVREKDVATYREVTARHGVDPAEAWMIGNSPKSDVLPALANGWGAVFIPHPATWVLELEPLPEQLPGRFVRLERFEDLTRHF